MKLPELKDHPEGGQFFEVFKSQVRVTTDEGQHRSALTHIYFSLEHGQVSRFHKVASDEVWNLYQGDGVRLYLWDGSSPQVDCVVLSAEATNFCHVVPAGIWQAAEPLGANALMGCSVGPGFEFQDFELINPQSVVAKEIIMNNPNLERFVNTP